MKKTIYLFAIILIFSCAPKKLITATKAEANTSVQNDIKDTNRSQTETKNTITDQSNTDIETVTKTTTYDTEKPNVPGTDKPPVKEVKETTEKRSNKGDIKINSETKKRDEATYEDNSRANNDAKSDNSTKEIPKTPAIAYLYYLLIFAAIVFSIFFVRKYSTVIKSFLGLK